MSPPFGCSRSIYSADVGATTQSLNGKCSLKSCLSQELYKFMFPLIELQHYHAIISLAIPIFANDDAPQNDDDFAIQIYMKIG